VISLAATLALAVVGVIALSGSPAHAANVNCGDTITTDTTLHHNLANCPHNGIVIGADNVTLDLNYHTIDGDGVSSPDFCECGVWNQGHDGVTVVHGSVRQFDAGVLVAKASHNRLLGLSSSRNQFSGIFFFRCDRCLLRNSAGNRTKGFGDQVGMFLFQSHHDRILHSTFRRNVPAGSGTGGGILAIESTNTVIRGNRMSRNGEAGIIMEKSDGFRIRHNRLVRNHDGILPGSDNVITRNHVFGGGAGIRMEHGHGNLIAHNVIAHTHHAGMDLGIFGGAHNVVRRNLVRDSRKDGFLIGKKGRHSRLKGNVAKRSGDDGFDIESRSAKLTSNRAVRNNDLGIEAVRGVIDGGGNIARHNGDPRQCTNIVCN
jgi:parallel beta-helix repeat protein